MDKKILVSRQPEDGLILITLVARIFFVIWLVFLVVALVSYRNGDETLLFMASFFGFFIVLVFLFLETLACLTRFHREWIRLFEDRFEYITRRNCMVYAYDDIDGVSLEQRSRPQTSGSLTEVTTHFWLKDDRHFEVVAVEIPQEETCPQEEVANRLKNHYLARAVEEFQGGNSIHGKNWSIDRRALRIMEKNGGEINVSIDSIAHAEVFEGKLFVWDCYESSPRLVLPIRTRNAAVLEDILQSRLKELKPVDCYGDPDDENNWGRMLYRFNWPFKTTWCFFISNIILVGVFIYLFNHDGEAYIWGILFSSLALVVTGFLVLAGNAITVFEKGLIYKNSFGTRELAFEHIGRYALRQSDSHQYGIYISSSFDLTLIPDVPHLKRVTLTLSSTTPDLPGPMRNIKDRVQAVCVDRLWRQLESEGGAKWTDEITLRRNEIVIACEKKTYHIAYRELSLGLEHISMPILGVDMEPHLEFFIRGSDSQKPIFKLSTHTDNFFPGYECLVRIIEKNVKE